jgi:putative glutamine amidotransferase
MPLTLEQLYHKTIRTGRSTASQPALPLVDTAPSRPRARRAAQNQTGLKSILCHRGTGTDTVRAVIKGLGGGLVVVQDTVAADELEMDGLLLLGGADIHPRWYGERDTHCQYVDKQRDAIEWTLVRRAITEGKPIMGICRGMQMLTAAAGGSLYQDVNAQQGTTHRHHGMSHELVDVDGRLAARIPSTRVNSLHHQAVKMVPYGWETLATAPDGVIESIWRPGALGVQWHPELLIQGGDTRWVSLFEWFMEGLS